MARPTQKKNRWTAFRRVCSSTKKNRWTGTLVPRAHRRKKKTLKTISTNSLSWPVYPSSIVTTAGDEMRCSAGGQSGISSRPCACCVRRARVARAGALLYDPRTLSHRAVPRSPHTPSLPFIEISVGRSARILRTGGSSASHPQSKHLAAQAHTHFSREYATSAITARDQTRRTSASVARLASDTSLS